MHKSDSSDWLASAALFAAGMFTPFTVSLVGKMPVGEVVLLFAGFWLACTVVLNHRWPGGLLTSRLLGTMMVCQGVALLGYVLSDMAWGSPVHSIARGWARMGFLALDIVAIAYLADGATTDANPASGPRRWTWLQWGMVVGGSIIPLVERPLFGEYWKFGFATPITIAVLLLTPRLGGVAAMSAIFGLGVLHMALRFRSMGAVCLLVGALLFVVQMPRRYRPWMMLPGLGLACAALLYVSGRSHGQYEKINERSDISRAAMIQAAINGFRDHPFMGNGSWFSKSKVMYDFVLIRYYKAREAGLGGIGLDVGDATEDNNEEMPFTLHSQILVGLAEGGILGGCFFLFYGSMLAWALYYTAFCQTWHRLTGIYFYTLLTALWNLVMSPFSGEHRVLIANAAVMILLLWRDAATARTARVAALQTRPDPAALPPWAYPRRV